LTVVIILVIIVYLVDTVIIASFLALITAWGELTIGVSCDL